MNRGVEMLMRFGQLATRLAPVTERQRAEMRGLEGVMNLEFTGPGESGWHVRFGDGRVQLGRGLAPAARATARIKPEDYLALVAGDLSYSVARMTGRIRVAGDGHFGMLLGAFFENMRAAQAERGVRGWIARRAVGRALRKGNYRRRKA